MLSFTLQTNAQVPLTANVVDQLGAPAQHESISWSVADEGVASIDATNGGTVNLIAHTEGATTVAVTVGSLTTLLHVTVAPVVASSVSIEIGTPVAKYLPQPVAAVPEPVPLYVETGQPAEAATRSADASAEVAHPIEGHAGATRPEMPDMGEATGREAGQPVAPPVAAEATAAA
jgi:hypothetical protein